MISRRMLLKSGAALAGIGALGHIAEGSALAAASGAPHFSTANQRWQAAYDKALSILANNVQVLPRYGKPVLIEGSSYAGIWQECGPHESLVYSPFRPDVARNSHMIFFALQRPDGQIPADNKRTETGFGQIQMVVPIAATAWDLARDTGDEELLHTAYESCSRWDAWLLRYRNTRGIGLTEGFCTYDTGMDNSPRWAGMPRQCPDKDAKICPAVSSLPRLCPDLSATVYGARIALASMAKALGKSSDADRWQESAEQLRRLILDRLYLPEDACFYDLDAQNKFVRVRCVILTRICGEHVVDHTTFEDMWRKQLGDPQAFWALYPLPSVALNDPLFVRPIPRNSWGGAAQALTALRTSRWMDHYGRSAEHTHLMEQWCEAILRDPTFRQQIDPLTGAFTQADLPNYSPASLVLVDFTWRLAGVRQEKDEIHWNLRPGSALAQNAHFQSKLRAGAAEIHYSKEHSALTLSGREIATVRGTARLVTNTAGEPKALVGVSLKTEPVELLLRGQSPTRTVLQPNQTLALQEAAHA